MSPLKHFFNARVITFSIIVTFGSATKENNVETNQQREINANKQKQIRKST